MNGLFCYDEKWIILYRYGVVSNRTIQLQKTMKATQLKLLSSQKTKQWKRKKRNSECVP